MLLFNRYEYSPQTDLLGKGGFSRVYKALDKKLNRFVALKIYKTGEVSERYSLGSEIQRVINLDHPNVSRYLDIEDLENENAFGEIEKIQVCVMELLDGGSILTYYRAHPDKAVLIKLLIDVLNGLAYLHQNDIIHRDIKPGNILIKITKNGPVAKITDFGISKIAGVLSNADSSSAMIVSIPYMAPEQLNVQKFGVGGQVSFNIDLWSLGVAVYEIVSGDVLFRNHPDDSPEQIMLNIMAPGLPAKIEVLPAPFRAFVASCVTKDASARTNNIDQLIEILQNKSDEFPAALDENKQPVEEVVEINRDTIVKERQVIDIPVSNIATVMPEAETEVALPDVNETIAIPKDNYRSLQDENSDSQATDDSIDDTRWLDVNTIPGNAKNSTGVQEVADTIPTPTSATLNDETQVLHLPSTIADNEPAEPALLLKGFEPESKDTDDTQILPSSAIPSTSLSNEKIDAGNQEPTTTSNSNTEEPENKILLFKRYEYYPNKNLIGKGGFSRVYKAFDKKLQRWVALKIYKTGNFSDRYSPIAEIQRVVNLDHSNICRYLDIEEIEKVNPFGEKETIQVCVMELLDSGNLAEYFEKNPDPKIFKKLLRDIFMGLAYLHKNGIIHRDIKPANILIKQTIEGPIAKITDFGISKKSDSVNSNSSSALVVSIPYMAPEQLNVKKYGTDGKITYNLDLWSLGVTIYEVLAGKVLFRNSDADNSEQIMTNIMAAGIPDKIHELPSPFVEIVARCIVKKAPERAQHAEELMRLLTEDANTAAVLSPPKNNDQTSSNTVTENAPHSQQTLTSAAGGKKNSNNSSSGFYVLEDETSTPAMPSKGRKRFLLPAIFLLVILAASIVFVIKRNKAERTVNQPTEQSILVAADTSTVTRHPNPNDSIHKTETTVAKDSIKNSPVVAPPVTVIAKKPIGEKKEKKAVQQIEKEKEPAGRAHNDADTYFLELSALVDCVVKINSFNYGAIKAHGRMKVWLSPGTYQIKATNLADNAEIYSTSIEVTANQLGKTGHLQIKQ